MELLLIAYYKALMQLYLIIFVNDQLFQLKANRLGTRQPSFTFLHEHTLDGKTQDLHRQSTEVHILLPQQDKQNIGTGT